MTPLILAGATAAGAIASLAVLGAKGSGVLLWPLAVATLGAAWLLMARLSNDRQADARFGWAVPVIFGLTLLFAWEVITRGFDIPRVLLPAPSLIGAALVAQAAILFADFQQTVLKSVIAGYLLGNGSAFMIALLVDRSPFLQRGLLPLGNLVSAIPIVGIAPIMVMWFGFDWPSKAAVIVVMTFFPMLISTLAGLQATDRMQRDLMTSYGASYGQTLLALRLPAAAPMIFNALKLNSTLALIGAIVAEFFGTPIVGMGFRISTEVARMNVDVVWATIAVASVIGSAFYGTITLIERRMTFWHPSFRKARG